MAAWRRRAPSSNATGRRCSPIRAPICATPRRGCRNGRKARGRARRAPVYTLIGARGPDHAPRFVVEAQVTGLPGTGEGGSKREAEQDAAAKLLASGRKPMTTRCGFAAIIGAPNAGKSTLINALVGSKVAIVTPKVQTTRMPVRGIAIAGETQIVFVDTPGIFKPGAGWTAPWSARPGRARKTPMPCC